MTLKEKNLIEKRNILNEACLAEKNVLNEVRKSSMGLQELRFFSIYLSKINARDKKTRVVRFPMNDFLKIMEIDKVNIWRIKQITDSLLCKLVHIYYDDGGYEAFQIFKKCRVFKENDRWYVEIEAHDDALPLMFNFKRDYFTYELWNALRLKSKNQLRMYEILKQYEKLGKREIEITQLREWLGLSQNEYTHLGNFKLRVLDSCQKALLENTDIKFTYERGQTGNGGKWLTIVFHIYKNENHKDKLSLDEFINRNDIEETNVIDAEASEVADTVISLPIIEQSSKALPDEPVIANNVATNKRCVEPSEPLVTENFPPEELKRALFNIFLLSGYSDEKAAEMLELAISIMKTQSMCIVIKNKAAYLTGVVNKLIENDMQRKENAKAKAEINKPVEKEQSYDIDEYETFAINYKDIIGK